MTKDEILKQIEKIAVESTDTQAQTQALIFLYNTHIAEEIKAETEQQKEKSKEQAKAMSELFAKSFDFNYGA